MDIITGIDRIALAVAIIATVLVFTTFGHIYYEDEKILLIKSRETGEYIEEPVFIGLKYYDKNRYIWEYKRPPIWQPMLVGVTGAGCTFLVVLFGIRLTTRGIKRFSLWIIDGFRDVK